MLLLKVFEDGVPLGFWVRAEGAFGLQRAAALEIETLRLGGARETFSFAAAGDGYLESLEELPEPHEFTATVTGMMVFIWLTMSGMERLGLGF